MSGGKVNFEEPPSSMSLISYQYPAISPSLPVTTRPSSSAEPSQRNLGQTPPETRERLSLEATEEDDAGAASDDEGALPDEETSSSEEELSFPEVPGDVDEESSPHAASIAAKETAIQPANSFLMERPPILPLNITKTPRLDRGGEIMHPKSRAFDYAGTRSGCSAISSSWIL